MRCFAGILAGVLVLSSLSSPARAASLTMGATTLGLLETGSMRMLQGELIMVGQSAGADTEIGMMIEQARFKWFVINVRTFAMSLFLERAVMQRTKVGLAVGMLAFFVPALSIEKLPAADLYGRVEVLRDKNASLGVLLGARYYGGIPPTVVTVVPHWMPRIALIGTGII
jgi:hypothetical protein